MDINAKLVSFYQTTLSNLTDVLETLLNNHSASMALILIVILFKTPISSFILKVAGSFVKRVKKGFNPTSLNCFKNPVSLLPVAVVFYEISKITKTFGLENVTNASVLISKTLPTIFVFWVLYILVDRLEDFTPKWEKFMSKALATWVVRILEIVIILMGIASVLELWGVAVAPIIASLGLFGVAVALGAQDLFKNLIAGMLVITERRFNIGDWIKVPGVVEGTVEHIGFRSTLVRQFDKAPVFVPNTKFSDTPVINFSEMTHRRIYWKIGVEYNTSIDQLKNIRNRIEEHLLQSGHFASPEDVSTFVRVDSFNDSSIDFMLYCFTNTTVWGEWLEIKEELAYKIKEIVESEGSAFAFPSRTIYHDFAGDTPESFIPPKNKK